MISLLVLVALGCLSLLGCGYSFVRYDSGGDSQPSLSLRTLENDSTEPGVELLMTEALRREFLRRGALRLVSDPEDADLVIRGRVLPLLTRSRSFSDVVLALEYDVTCSLELWVGRRDGSTLELDPNALRTSEIYLASADVESSRKNREEALRRLSSVLAGRVHDALDRELIQ
jgi:hypothetical protein